MAPGFGRGPVASHHPLSGAGVVNMLSTTVAQGAALLEGAMNQQNAAGQKSQGGRLSGGAILSIVGVALLVIFMIQNTEKIRFHFLAWHFTMALWLFTLIAALVGALVWFGLGVIRRHRRRRGRRDY